MNKKKITKIISGISVAILFIFSMWFFILYGIANPYAYQKLDMLEKPQNKTKEVTVNYNFELKSPTIIIQQSTDKTISSTINVGTILFAIITSGITVIMTKIADRLWYNKKDK
jgi:hypothetical protein